MYGLNQDRPTTPDQPTKPASTDAPGRKKRVNNVNTIDPQGQVLQGISTLQITRTLKFPEPQG